MKRKTIKAVLAKKFNEWVDSIEDESVRSIVWNNTIITGGSIVSMLLNEPVKDFDVYFRNKETVLAVAKYYCDKFNEKIEGRKTKTEKDVHAWVLDGEDVEAWKNGDIELSQFAYDYDDTEYNEEDETFSVMIRNVSPERVKVMVNSDGVAEDERDRLSPEELLEAADGLNAGLLERIDEERKDRYRPVFLSTNAITLSDKMQLVVRFYGEPDVIHSTYDFVHATCYWDSKSRELTLPARALEAILNKELFYTGSAYPIASIIRTRKFIKRGWQINAGQYLKMCFQISELNLHDISVLEDQLIGVDSYYFMGVVRFLSKKQSEQKDFTYDSMYLITVIDKIFG